MFVAGNRRHFQFGMPIVVPAYRQYGRCHVTWSTLNFKALNIPQE